MDKKKLTTIAIALAALFVIALVAFIIRDNKLKTIAADDKTYQDTIKRYKDNKQTYAYAEDYMGHLNLLATSGLDKTEIENNRIAVQALKDHLVFVAGGEWNAAIGEGEAAVNGKITFNPNDEGSGNMSEFIGEDESKFSYVFMGDSHVYMISLGEDTENNSLKYYHYEIADDGSSIKLTSDSEDAQNDVIVLTKTSANAD